MNRDELSKLEKQLHELLQRKTDLLSKKIMDLTDKLIPLLVLVIVNWKYALLTFIGCWVLNVITCQAVKFYVRRLYEKSNSLEFEGL